MSESSSSLHQMYPTMTETGRDHNFKTDPGLAGSPIHQAMFAPLPNLALFPGGNTSPTLNPLLSPSGSPIYGNLPQPNSVSSITQGDNR